MTRKRDIRIGMGALIMAAMLLSGCIKENLEDCTTDIRFEYTHNMLNSNAFGEQVDEVLLYVFDEGGVLCRKIHVKGDYITNDYVMRLNDLPKGTYQFVAWARDNQLDSERAHFLLPGMSEGSSTIDELTASLQLVQGARMFDGDLNNLLVGHVPNRFVNQSTSGEVTIPLKKVNSTVRVILIESGGQEVSTANYSIRIEEEEGNGVVNSLYEVVPDGKITYRPYYYESFSARNSEVARPEEKEKAVVAEYAVSRLIEGHDIRLIVEDKAGETVVNKNLLELIRLVEMEGNVSKWSFQEYLDRQDEYAVTLYVDGDASAWLTVTLIINGWVINDIEIEI